MKSIWRIRRELESELATCKERLRLMRMHMCENGWKSFLAATPDAARWFDENGKPL